MVNTKIYRQRCAMFTSVFIENIMESSSNETNSQESCIPNQGTLTNL